MKEPFDELERELFALLKPNARISNRQVAERLGVTEGAIRHRLRKLEAAGSMRTTTLMNSLRFGRVATAYVRLTVAPAHMDRVVQALKKIDEVGYLARVSGGADINATMNAPSFTQLFTVYSEQITPLQGIQNAQINVISRVFKHRYELCHILDEPQ